MIMPAFSKWENGNVNCMSCDANIDKCKCIWSAIRDLQHGIRQCVSFSLVQGHKENVENWQKVFDKRLSECEMKVAVHRETSFSEREAASHILKMDERIKSLELQMKQCADINLVSNYQLNNEKWKDGVLSQFNKIFARCDDFENINISLKTGLNDIDTHVRALSQWAGGKLGREVNTISFHNYCKVLETKYPLEYWRQQADLLQGQLRIHMDKVATLEAEKTEHEEKIAELEARNEDRIEGFNRIIFERDKTISNLRNEMHKKRCNHPACLVEGCL